MILTYDEMMNLSDAYENDSFDLIREVEKAVLAKLAEGVSVEPVGYLDGQGDAYTLDQLNTAVSTARVRALEDAAEVVLNYQAGWVPDGFTECADAIRALKRGG